MIFPEIFLKKHQLEVQGRKTLANKRIFFYLTQKSPQLFVINKFSYSRFQIWLFIRSVFRLKIKKMVIWIVFNAYFVNVAYTVVCLTRLSSIFFHVAHRKQLYLTDYNNDVIGTATIQITIFSQFAAEIGKTIDEYTTKSESKSMKIYRLRIIEVIFASNKRRFVG